MELDFGEIRELLAILNQTDVAELSIKSSDFELTVRKQDKAIARPPSADSTVGSQPAALPVAPALATPAVSLPPVPLPAASPPSNERLIDVVSPMVGTFYRSPAPDEPPFVEAGDRVKSGQTVCIIEAMKLMNEIETEISGEVVEILVQNAEPVEYGQTLMRINPA